MIDLDDLEKKARSATPGNWVVANQVNNDYRLVEAYEIASGEDGELICRLDSDSDCIANQEFIAAANPQAVLALVDRIKFLEEEIEGLTHEGRQGELEQANVGLAQESVNLQAKLKIATEALEFYGDRTNWFWDGEPRTLEPGTVKIHTPGGCNPPTTRLAPDMGEKARAALVKIRGGE